MSLSEAVRMLGLDCDPCKRAAYIACPKCQSANELRRKEYKLRLNFDKDVFRCAKCADPKASGTEGGPVAFWMLMKGIGDPKEAAKDYYRQRDGLPASEKKKWEKPAPKPVPEAEEAPVEVKDHTYKALFSICSLRKRHLQELINVRGLTAEDVKDLGYKSTPRDGKATAAKLLKMGCTLKGVPPFYQEEDGTYNMKLYKRDGVMMPKLNARGQIQGVEICMNPGKDPGYTGAKYLPFSSEGMPYGTPSHTFVHFRIGERGLSRVILTEGVLKADIISKLSGYSVLSVSGVNCQAYLPGAFRALKNVDIFQGIYVCFDNDMATNENVRRSFEKLSRLLEEYEIPFIDKSQDWPVQYKGFDDYLIAKNRTTTKGAQ